MPYSVDIAKPALTLLLEEFNSENGSSYTFDDVSFVNFKPNGGPNGLSSIGIELKDQSVYTGQVTIYYNRMDLSYIFSLVGLFVKYVDYVVPTDRPVVNTRLLQEIARRYRFPFNQDEFNFVDTDGVLTIIATDTNVAFKGSVVIQPSIRDQLDMLGISIHTASQFIEDEIITVYPLI
jgi:hypothetical protein